ncbi:unnamed protein product [Symbiodinium sp. CCMP2592]|nr:unnamed protein product [Symbiodinium sp. CCMP2592]
MAASFKEDEVNMPVMRESGSDGTDPDDEAQSTGTDLVEDATAQAGSTLEAKLQMTAVAHLIARQELTRPEVLRTTPARRVLSCFCRVLRDGAYSSDLYKYSASSTEIPQFWSHSWHGRTSNKIMLLLTVFNGFPASVLGSLAVLFCLLWSRGRGKGHALAMAVGLVVSVLACLFWRPQRRVFLDKICIHQTDSVLKAEGVFNVAAMLKHSTSMMVCWDTTYIHRLWCVLEIAAFLKSHGSSAKLHIKPLLWGFTAVFSFVGLTTFFGLLLVFEVDRPTQQPPDEDQSLLSIVLPLAVVPIAALCLAWVAATLRAHFRDTETVLAQLRGFSFERDPVCHCCSVNHTSPTTGTPMPCDRELLAACVALWFGSVADFDTYVQQDVAAAFEENLGQFGVPYSWIVGSTVPVLWWAPMYSWNYTLNPDGSFLRGTVRDNMLGAATIMYWVAVWWLLCIPMIFLFWQKILRKGRRRRSRVWQEVLINLACGISVGLIYTIVQLLDVSGLLAWQYLLGEDFYLEAWLASSSCLMVILLCLLHGQGLKLLCRPN